MEALSEKIFLKLDMPNDQNRRGDRDKIFDALKEKYAIQNIKGIISKMQRSKF